MLLRDSLRLAINRLTAANVPSPRMNAELLLMFTLGCDRAFLFAHPEREITAEESERYDKALAQRASGIPAQYITGHQEFWGMDFIVTPAVLIPRPETEHLIEVVLPLARAMNIESSAPTGQPRAAVPTRLKIVDVGTGSGCIAITLAKELPQAEIYATDISPEALEISCANAARHQLQERIQFHEGDLLSHFLDSKLATRNFDFVVSNPPYVGESEEDQVQLEVRKFEPRNAVFAGSTGLEIIERLIPQAQQVLKPEGWLVMEVSGTIVEGVKKLLASWGNLQITNDLQGIPRIAAARKPFI
ncbi:MAG TPA: peptide chain release factor N(5)-glutamine methyltransferase [Terriglobales bacterium]|nr:peptide chain release factor N(5)-glutamine methyltransferase [Terriglobales bacterium]